MKQLNFENFFTEATEPEKNEELETFIQKRKAGAAKLAKQATMKGGLSNLTAVHFRAKSKPYDVCAKNLGDKKVIKDHVNDLLKQLKSWEGMSQLEFQKVVGELEVYGEVGLQIKNPKKY